MCFTHGWPQQSRCHTKRRILLLLWEWLRTLGTFALKAAHVKPTVNASTSTRLGTFFLPPNLKVVLKFCRHCADIAGKKAPQKFQFCVRSTIIIWYHIRSLILFRRVLSPLLNSSLWLMVSGFRLPHWNTFGMTWGNSCDTWWSMPNASKHLLCRS